MNRPEQHDLVSNPEWTEEDVARAKPAPAVHGDAFAAQLVRRRGRPAMAEGERKEKVTLRLSPDILTHFRSLGEGWQTRIDETLRAAVAAARQGER